MATYSHIEWTERTWNPVVGCSKSSPGCTNCYAERMSARQVKMAANAIRPTAKRHHYLEVINEQGRWNHRVEVVDAAMDEPLHWKEPRVIFVNSMSDLFHENLSVEDIQRVFSVMNQASQHQFQVLTKRAQRLEELAPLLTWTPNIWMGVSIENDRYQFRADHLRRTAAAVKFLSVEPLLGLIPKLRLDGLDWVIVGGESGPRCRPMRPDWARSIRDQCIATQVPFFFKQWGHIRNNPDPADPTEKKNGGKAKGGRTLDGRIWDQIPKAAAWIRRR